MKKPTMKKTLPVPEIDPAIAAVRDMAIAFGKRNSRHAKDRKDIVGWDYGLFITQLSYLERARQRGWCEEPWEDFTEADLHTQHILGR